MSGIYPDYINIRQPVIGADGKPSRTGAGEIVYDQAERMVARIDGGSSHGITADGNDTGAPVRRVRLPFMLRIHERSLISLDGFDGVVTKVVSLRDAAGRGVEQVLTLAEGLSNV